MPEIRGWIVQHVDDVGDSPTNSDDCLIDGDENVIDVDDNLLNVDDDVIDIDDNFMNVDDDFIDVDDDFMNVDDDVIDVDDKNGGIVMSRFRNWDVRRVAPLETGDSVDERPVPKGGAINAAGRAG